MDTTHVGNVQQAKEEGAEVFQACATIPILVKGESERDGGKEVGSMDHIRAFVCQLCCALIRGCTSTLSQPGKPSPTKL